MELARQIRRQEREIQPLIIFVTGYDSYVYDAFDVDAFQYLVKPVEEEKFAQVFKRALERIAAGGDHRKKAQTITLKTAGTSRTLPLDQILYIESSNHKAVLHLTDKEFACYAKIRDLEEELRDCFFRIHKGYLVNLAYVDGYSKKELTVSGGETLMISKYKYQDFVKAHLHFLKKEPPYERDGISDIQPGVFNRRGAAVCRPAHRLFSPVYPRGKGREICSSSSPSILLLNWPAIGRRFPREPSG